MCMCVRARGNDDNVCDASSRSIFSHVDRLSFVCLAVCVRLSVNVCMCVHEALFYKYIYGGDGDDDCVSWSSLSIIHFVLADLIVCREILHRFHFAKHIPCSHCPFSR